MKKTAVFVAVTVMLIALPLLGQPTKDPMSTPTIQCAGSTANSINIQFTAGATGAPAGFSIQWMLKSEYDVYGWSSDAESYCAASFSGNARRSNYNLGANQSVVVNIGANLFDDPGASTHCPEELLCDTAYVFRAFAHANNQYQRSAFSATLECSTGPCNGCTHTQGYWKTHGPTPTGNNSNEWPVDSLTLGTVLYTDLELQAIFDTPAAGNGLIALAHQLIAAKLNVESGAIPSAGTQDAIDGADALIGSLVVPPVGSGSLSPSATSAYVSALTNFNEGVVGTYSCGSPE